MMRLSVFGLGYVGAVSLGCLVRDGHDLVGVDIDPSKLDLIRRGQSPVIEAGMQDLIANAVASGRVQVTSDTAAAVRASEVSFLCVGTPPRPNGSQDLSAMERLCRELGDAMRTKDAFHVFVVRSTVMPGTVEGMIRRSIEEHSGKRLGEHFGLCFQPEFMREGSSIRDYDKPPMTVVGGDSKRSVETLRKIFGHLPCAFHVTSIRVAETLKYFCNIFHALKITFANEVGRICQALEVDPHQVMDLVCKDTQLNISTAYLKPGFAFGGSCLPKDLRALTYVARQADVDLPMLQAVMPSNRAHIDHAVATVLAAGERRVGMIGLSFKSGTDDLRESPLVTVAERFLGKGIDLKVHDPEVSLSRLVGANRRYIEEVIPHIGNLMVGSAAELIRDSKVVVVGIRSPEIEAALREHLRDDHMLLDLVHLPDRGRLRGRYVGVCW
jgi:GDP-mannose 6-dehydrogenase